MKKNYLKPAIKAQIFSVKSVMLEGSPTPIGSGMEEGEENVVKEHLLDDWIL